MKINFQFLLFDYVSLDSVEMVGWFLWSQKSTSSIFWPEVSNEHIYYIFELFKAKIHNQSDYYKRRGENFRIPLQLLWKFPFLAKNKNTHNLSYFLSKIKGNIFGVFLGSKYPSPLLTETFTIFRCAADIKIHDLTHFWPFFG